MPNRFTSPMCSVCGREEEETCSHRYLHCELVSCSWEWVRTILALLEPSTVLMDDISILRLEFPQTMRDNALIWLIGIYVELVEVEVVGKGHNLDHASLKGHFRQRKQQSYQQAIPDIGPIPGIDWVPQGIG